MKLISPTPWISIAALVMVGCATAPPARTMPTVNVAGDWHGDWTCENDDAGNGIIVLVLTQRGNAVTGHSIVTNPVVNRTGGRVEGVVSDSSFRVAGPDVSLVANVTGDRMNGTFKGPECIGKLGLQRVLYKETAARSRLTTIAATVEAIDAEKRQVTLQESRGNLRTFQVDPRVSLSRIAAGDQVNVAYYESWAMNVGTPGDSSGSLISEVAQGAPVRAGYAARTVAIPATVEAVDEGKSSITFKGPEGRSVEVSIDPDPNVLGRFKAGETYDLVYTEALAVRIDKASKP